MANSGNNSLLDKDHNMALPNIDNNPYSSTSDQASSGGIFLSTTHTEISSSPLPSPEILKGYAEIIPNSPERFMQLIEKEQENKFKNDRSERDKTKAELDLKRKGQTMAFVLVLVFLAIGTTLALVHESVISYVIFGMTMVPAIGLFYRHK